MWWGENGHIYRLAKVIWKAYEYDTIKNGTILGQLSTTRYLHFSRTAIALSLNKQVSEVYAL